MALSVCVGDLLNPVVDLVVQVTAGRVSEAPNPLITGNPIGKLWTNLPGHDCHVDLDLPDAELLARVQRILTIGIQNPDKADMLSRMIRLHTPGVNRHCCICTTPNRNLLTLKKLAVGV